MFLGVEPAVTTTEHVAIADNIAVEQHPSKSSLRSIRDYGPLTALTARSVLTTEELWQLPKIPKSNFARPFEADTIS